jgi:hypothetical protein
MPASYSLDVAFFASSPFSASREAATNVDDATVKLPLLAFTRSPKPLAPVSVTQSWEPPGAGPTRDLALDSIPADRVFPITGKTLTRNTPATSFERRFGADRG